MIDDEKIKIKIYIYMINLAIVANYIKNQSNHCHNLLSHKTYSWTVEKEITLFTIGLFVIQRRIIIKMSSESRKATVSFDHNEKKKKKRI